MALSASVMAQIVVNGLKSSNDKITGEAEADLLDSWTTICQGLIDHITTAAVVTVTVAPGIPVSTAGSAVAQTGATTAPGSGTGTVA